MVFRVPGLGGHPDPLTIFVSHPVVPIQQVFHRENQKIWTMLPNFFLFSKKYNNLKHNFALSMITAETKNKS